MTEQDHTMFASFALMGILARIDGPVSGANKAHWAAEAWSWADAMVDAGARRAQAHEATDDTPPRDPAAAPAAADSSSTTTSDR